MSSDLPDSEWPDVTLSEEDGVRYLHLGTPWVQGAMRLARPQWVELDYVQRMLSSLLWLPSAALGQGQAVQLGLGAGAITRFTLGALRMHTTVVEINPEVISACRAWFRLPHDDARLNVVQADAGAWLRQQAQKSAGKPRSAAAPPSLDAVSLLHVDLYDHEAAAPVLDSLDFYRDCQALLAPGGLMSVNLFGRASSFETSLARIVQAFGTDQVWSLQPTREGNTAVVAGRGVQVPEREVLIERAALLEERFKRQGLPARKWLRMVRPYRAAASAASFNPNP